MPLDLSLHSVFKPLIASSLAIVLGGGILSGQDIEVNDANQTQASPATLDTVTYGDGTQEKKLSLQGGDNTIATLTFKDTTTSSTNNFLVLNSGKTTITNQINIGAEKAILFDLANGTELNLAGGIDGSGKSRVRVLSNGSGTGSGYTVTLSGGTINGVAIEFMGGGTQELKLQNNNATLRSIEMNTSSTGEKTLTLDTMNNSVSASVNSAVSGEKLNLKFGGKANNNSNANSNTASFTFQNSGSNALKSISIANASSVSDNTLTLSAGSLNVTDQLSIENGKGLTLNLGGNATFQGNILNKGDLKINFNSTNKTLTSTLTTGDTSGTTNINISDNSSGTITGNITTNTNGNTNINFANGSGAKTLTLQGNNNTLSSITLNSGGATTNNTLILQSGNTSVTQQVSITAQQGLTLNIKNGVNLTLAGLLTNAGNAGVDFSGTSTLTSSITTTAGNTNISLNNGANSTITSNISTSGGETTITFNGRSSTLTLNNGSGTITTSGGKTTIDFESSNGILKSKLDTQGGETEIKLTRGAQGTITNDIASSNGGANSIKYSGISTLTLQGSTNALSSLDTSGVQGTLIVDATNNANSTSIDKAILGDKLIVNLKGTESNKATLTLNNSSNNSSTSSMIKTLTLTNSTEASQNIFSLTGGTTTVTDGINIEKEQGLSVNLSNGANLNSNIKNSSGNTEIHFNTPTGGTIGGTISTTTTLGTSDKGTKINIANGANGTIKGNITTGENANTTIIFETDTANQPSGNQANTLTLQGKTNQINTITVNGDSKTLVLDGKNSNSGVNVDVKTTITGGKLTAKFDGTTNKATNLTLNASGNTLKALTLGDNSTHNTLILNSGNTTITDKVAIGSNQALDFALNSNSNLTLSGNLENSGNSNINFSDTSTLTSTIDTKASGITNINIAGDSSGTITGNVTTDSSGATNVKYAPNSGDNINSLTLQGENNTLTSISFDQRARTGRLILGDNTHDVSTTVSGNISGDSVAGGKLIVGFNGSSHTSHLTLNGNTNALKAIELTGTQNTLTLTAGNTTITDWVRVQASQGVAFDINNANLTFNSSLFNEGGQTHFKLTGSTTVNGDITTKSELTGTTIHLSNNPSGTNAIFSGVVSKDSQSSMGVTTLQFASGANTKKITLQGSGNTLNSITLGDTTNPPIPNQSTNNTLALTNGNTTIESEVEVQSSQALAFDLANGTNLALSGNLKTSGGNADINFSGNSALSSSINTTSGTTTLNVTDSANGNISDNITTASSGATTNINFKSATSQNTNSLSLNGSGDNQITTLTVEDGGNAQLKGKNATITTLELGKTNGNSKLTLFNTQSTITTLTPSANGATTLSIDGTLNSSSTSITNTVNGNDLTLNFNGRGDSKKAELTLQHGDNTLKALTLEENSTANTLYLSSGKTTFTDKINVANGTDITFDLGASTELALTNGMDTSGISTLQVVANGGTRSATLSGGNTTATHLKLTGNTSSASVTLKNPQVNLTTLTTSGSAENTLTLDTSTQGVQTAISQAINGSNLKVELKGVSDKTAKLSLENANNGTNTTSTIKALTLGDNSANGVAYNTLELRGGSTIITDALSIDTNKGINFDFSGTSSLQNTLTNSGGVLALNFQNGIGTLNGSISTSSGNTSITLSNGASGVITGSVNGNGNTTINYKNGTSAKTLTLQGGGNKIDSITLDSTNSSTHNTLNLQTDDTSVTQKLEIKNAQKLTTNLSSNANLTLTGNLENSGNHTINFNGTSHTLTSQISTFSGGATSINLSSNTQAKITGDTSSAGNTNINLANNSSLELQTKLSTTAGTTTIEFKGENGSLKGNIETTSSGTTTFNLGLLNSHTSLATLDGILTNTSANQIFNINAKSTTLKSGDNGLCFSSGNNTINFNTEDSILSWQNKNGTLKDITTSGGSTKIVFQNNGTLASGITTSKGSTEINIQQNKFATILENITTSGSGKNNLTFSGSNSTLILKGSNNTISSVSSISGNNNIISLSGGEANDKRTEQDSRRKLTIENITQDSKPLTLISQTTATQADTFIINGSTAKTRSIQQPSTHSLGIVVANGVKLSDIGKSGEILVASVKNDSGITFGSSSQVVSGFTTATATFSTKATDKSGTTGSQDYTSYFIKSMQDVQVIVAEQEITATAFTLNYDLYMANFNSLNKRMGELRENAHSHGVWARVFNGALSNDFGLGTKTNYTTIQAGYDYAFGREGANNYLGFALSYALSASTSEHAFDVNSQKRSIDGIYSNAFEVALYNSYVSDEGWYNDTIAKFSYIMSDFKINNITDPNNTTSTTNDTKNFALTLSDEVGYKFTLGEEKEWGVTPQLELGFGYFNQSNFKQTLQDIGAFLQSNADAVMTLRTRAGSSFSYDFKNFTQPKDFNASLYLGVFYEYDYVKGGEITFRTDQITQDTTNNLSNLQSDGRAVINVGTNMSIKDNTRLYFDFEKSFAGKINTDYQVNFGVRYSFGESNGYTPISSSQETEENKAPLKIQETNQENTQESISKD